MAQTKRKRRNKHRGNAVGAVEARGRTSKPRPGSTPAQGRKSSGARGAAGRPLKPPTLQSAALKALFGGVVLFFFARLGLLGDEATTAGALGLAAVAMIFYTPIMFLTDKWVYGRKMRAQSGKR